MKTTTETPVVRLAAGLIPWLWGVGVALFWWLAHPELVSYREQFQLFLLSDDYLLDRLSLPGGAASYLGEMLMQTGYVTWLGALTLGLLVAVVAWLVGHRTGRVLALVPSVLLLWLLGDPDVLPAYVVALAMVVAGAHCRHAWQEVLLVPLLFWLAGPLTWTFVGLRMVAGGWRRCWLAAWLLAVQLAAWWWLAQWPLQSVLLGMGYYRVPLQWPALMWVVPAVTVALAWLHADSRWLSAAGAVVAGVLVWPATSVGYDADTCELLRQDYLIRYERWGDLVDRAQHHVVRTPFWSNSVNLALAQQGQLADRMFDYYQSGQDALLMPMKRDLMSNLPTAEAFWRLGMVNSALRYASDLQESILNGCRSGRLEQRIVECLLVNGQYGVARKHIALLKQSLFYRAWAEEAEAYLGDEARINAHPVWGRQRQLRFHEDFLYSYPEKEKMLGRLFMGNTDNRMALDYFMGQLLLNGDMQTFVQALPLAQRYGGQQRMPLGYQDALSCMQQVGNSPYGRYVQRMTAARPDSQKQQQGNETAH